MFRFDSFRSQSQTASPSNSTREEPQATQEDSKLKFLQRISSSDSIDKNPLTKRPSFSSLSSFSGRSASSSSTIPVPANSWGMLMLSTLRNDDMLEDVCTLLTRDQKASKLTICVGLCTEAWANHKAFPSIGHSASASIAPVAPFSHHWPGIYWWSRHAIPKRCRYGPNCISKWHSWHIPKVFVIL